MPDTQTLPKSCKPQHGLADVTDQDIVSALANRIEQLEQGVEQMRRLLPPKWVGPLIMLVVGLGISLETWSISHLMRLEGNVSNIDRELGEHKLLPIHPGAAQELKSLRDEIGNLRGDVRVLTAAVDRLEKGKP